MTPKQEIKHCMYQYPTLFERMGDVMHHLFFTIGNGYEWHNGELVTDLDDDHEPREIDEISARIILDLQARPIDYKEKIDISSFSDILHVPPNVKTKWLKFAIDSIQFARDHGKLTLESRTWLDIAETRLQFILARDWQGLQNYELGFKDLVFARKALIDMGRYD